MKLQSCPVCSNECSPNANSCPKCGHPFVQSPPSSKDLLAERSGNPWKFLTIGLGAFLLLGLVGFGAYLLSGVGTRLVGFSTRGLSEMQTKAVDEALTELRKLEAAADLGTTKSDYHRQLVLAKAATTKATQSIEDSELKTALSSTIQIYDDANTLWNIRVEASMFTSNFDQSFFLACFEQPTPSTDTNALKNSYNEYINSVMCDPVGSELSRKYNLPLRDYKTGAAVKDKGKVVKSEALTIFWEKAKQELGFAQQLFKPDSSEEGK